MLVYLMQEPSAAKITNLFEGIPTQLPQELTQVLLQSGKVRIERIVSAGQASPPGFWYDQEWDEWVILIQGGTRLLMESGQETSMKPGDFLHIPAHQRHRVEWTDLNQQTIWLAVHFDAG